MAERNLVRHLEGMLVRAMCRADGDPLDFLVIVWRRRLAAYVYGDTNADWLINLDRYKCE